MRDFPHPHTFVTGGTGAGKSSTLGTLGELAHFQGAPFVFVDPEGQFGPLPHSAPGTVVMGGEDGDVPLSVETIGKVMFEAFRNRASVVLRLDDLSRTDQRIVVACVVNTFMNMPKRWWAYYLIAIDEVHLFVPQQGTCESSLPIAEAAARGRRRGLKLVLATQRPARVAKDAISQCGNILAGKISIPADLRVAAETLGLTSQQSMRLLSLSKGSFIARGPDVSDEPVEVHIRKPRTVLDGTIEMKAATAEPVLTGETLVAGLRAAGIGEHDSSHIGKVQAEDDAITPARRIASEKSGAVTASSCSDTALAILQLLASSSKKSLPAGALSLLLRGEAARTAIDATLLDLRRRRLIVGHKRLMITAAGARLLGNATRPSRTLAERIGAIRLSLPKDAVRILDALSAAGQALATAEIARRTGGAERSRKLRKLLAQLSRAGLVRKRQGHFVIAPGYAALTDL